MFLGGSNDRKGSPIIDKAELSSIFNSANLKFLPMTPESDNKPSSANNNIFNKEVGRDEKMKIGQYRRFACPDQNPDDQPPPRNISTGNNLPRLTNID